MLKAVNLIVFILFVAARAPTAIAQDRNVTPRRPGSFRKWKTASRRPQVSNVP